MKRLTKNIFSLLIFALLTSSIAFVSCEDSLTDEICNTDSEYNAYMSALNAFSSNPTRSTCNNLKSTARAFISKAGSCGGVDVSSAQEIINTIDCSDF